MKPVTQSQLTSDPLFADTTERYYLARISVSQVSVIDTTRECRLPLSWQDNGSHKGAILCTLQISLLLIFPFLQTSRGSIFCSLEMFVLTHVSSVNVSNAPLHSWVIFLCNLNSPPSCAVSKLPSHSVAFPCV